MLHRSQFWTWAGLLMRGSTSERKEAIRHSQNKLLYQGVKYTVFGSLLAACVASYVFGPMASSPLGVWIWFCSLVVVYLARGIDLYQFNRSQTPHLEVWHWARRFRVGALASAVVWASSMWLIFPLGNQAHQVLLVLTLGAVAGGAIASLPYDTRLSYQFQLLIFSTVILRLLVEGNSFALELVLFSLFVFGFLLSCGKEVGKGYLDLLRLRQDSQETNLTLIQTTEEMARIGYWQWDLVSSGVQISTNLSLILGLDAQHADIRATFSRVHTDDRLKVETVCAQVIESGQEAEVECRMDGAKAGELREMRVVVKLISDSEGKESLLGVVQDLTDIKTAEKKIYSMAYYDELTGLANRAHFHERLEDELGLAELRGQRFAIIKIDLDDFKSVNESYGHECGDAYLMHFAHYLQEMTRHSDLLARLGGDEFCLLASDIDDLESVEDTVKRCMAYCDHYVQLGNRKIYPSLSIGVATYPADGQRADELTTCADMAVYTVKQSGKRHYAFYEAQMAKDKLERVRMEADLRQALANDEFELWYQPKIDIVNNRLMGVEALIRWRHPEKGMIRPDLFIPAAERVGMIKDIGEWVFVTACAQLRGWNEQGLSLSVAVNISGDHFVADNFSDFVFKVIEESGLIASDIEIEITESLYRNPEEHTLICRKLRSHGVRIAIDDFGTGYSSLSMLPNLEVDTLKIDKSFIDGIVDNPASMLLVRSIIDLSLGLGFDVVAEGVETEAQLGKLREKHCPYVQGYFFSRPVEADLIPDLMNADWEQPRAA